MSGISITNNNGGISPVNPDIEFLQGNDLVNVGPNATTHILKLIGDNVQGVDISGNAGTNTSTVTIMDATTTQKGVVLLSSDSFTGSGTTVGAVTTDLITIPLGAVAGTFQIESRAKGFESTGPAGCGYNNYATFTTDGVTATLVGNQDVFNEDPTLVDADAYFVAVGNDAVLQVLGVAGLTINWSAQADKT
jgi:hypothetical protein